MQVGHDVIILREGREQPGRHIGRIEGTQTDPRQAGDAGQPFQKQRQVLVLGGRPVPPASGGLAVSTDMDACYDNLLVPGCHEGRRLGQHVIGRVAVNFRPRSGYNAIGTEGVATVLDLEKRAGLATESTDGKQLGRDT